MEEIKVEFEVKAFGEEMKEDYEEAIKSCEIFRTMTLPKNTTIDQLESIVSELFDEMKVNYADQKPQLGAKIVLRSKEENDRVISLG
ncbi:hypothetical protein [Halobacillus sp. B23F22_1]|uniref:hypothetical protein n=1 Tax=Halobacillus sp. B23F22_1 TaxID=3459514 RepID=UPI00373F043A